MTSQSPRHGLDLSAIVLLAVFWGMNWPAVRIALYEVPPWTLRAIGMGAGALFLAALTILRRERLRPESGEWLPILAAGFFSITQFNLLLAFAQLLAPTTRAVIVTYTMPVWTILFARLLLGERLDGRRWTGLILGVAGLLGLGWPLVQAGTFSYGLALALLAGMSWALGTIISKRFPVATPSMSVVAWQLAGGATVAAIGAVVFESESPVDWTTLRAETWMALGYHIIFAQALAYMAWYKLLDRLPAGTVSLSMLLVPAIGVMGSILMLGEHPTFADYAGLLLMTAAASAVHAPRRTRAP
ncbi:DMT family transporter [Castellaniella sp. GW247-6E4]|uniref:DMT family transporter n=1 Tax=Castellaniella sp. GW247-6E4 TaxID=3140380 RepID=UPI0033164458